MSKEFLFYIIKSPKKAGDPKAIQLPRIIKIQRNDNFIIEHKSKNAEGPFSSIFELKRRSIIFNTIQLQKHRQRVENSKNIEEILDVGITDEGTSYEKTFIDALDHITVGKITNQKVQGVHFHNPLNTRIIKKISTNEKTGVYSAKIAKLNINTGEWIEKDSISDFFPDNWSGSQLLFECNFAYQNRQHIDGQRFTSKTISGVEVIFIINSEGKILTFHPVVHNNN